MTASGVVSAAERETMEGWSRMHAAHRQARCTTGFVAHANSSNVVTQEPA